MSDHWTLAYETDANGNSIGGDLARFVQSVRAGADVKIIYSPRQDIWWSRNCQSVQVSRSGTLLISASFMEAADTDHGGAGISFSSPFALEYHLYNTTGVRYVTKLNPVASTIGTMNSRDIIRMRWYVKDEGEISFLDMIVSPVRRVINAIFRWRI